MIFLMFMPIEALHHQVCLSGIRILLLYDKSFYPEMSYFVIFAQQKSWKITSNFQFMFCNIKLNQLCYRPHKTGSLYTHQFNLTVREIEDKCTCLRFFCAKFAQRNFSLPFLIVIFKKKKAALHINSYIKK